MSQNKARDMKSATYWGQWRCVAGRRINGETDAGVAGSAVQNAGSMHTLCATPSGLNCLFRHLDPGFDEYIEPWALGYNPFGVKTVRRSR